MQFVIFQQERSEDMALSAKYYLNRSSKNSIDRTTVGRSVSCGLKG